jgi:hypothetical protein
MRLFILFITFLSAVAALTLNKIDGTTIELGDEPAVVDFSNVIMPARAPVTESSAHNARDATDVNAADWDRGAPNVCTRYQLSPVSLTITGSFLPAHQLQRQCRDGLPLQGWHEQLHDLVKHKRRVWTLTKFNLQSLIHDRVTIEPSSIRFDVCPDGAPNHGRKFYCFFYRRVSPSRSISDATLIRTSTGHCEPTARSLFLHGSVGNLATNPATIGWNVSIVGMCQISI